MGIKYLQKNYLWYFSSEKTFLLVAKNDKSKIIGFAGGLIVDEHSIHGSSTSMIQFTFKEALLALLIRPWLFFHPQFLKNYLLIWKNIKLIIFSINPYKLNFKFNNRFMESNVGLVVIGTLNSSRGRGVGSFLLIKFEEFVKNLGIENMNLTVKKTNITAIKAYERNEWSITAVGSTNLTMSKRVKSSDQ
jgi:ribosomal protein S18 acetylase RimI-like enzyme